MMLKLLIMNRFGQTTNLTKKLSLLDTLVPLNKVNQDLDGTIVLVDGMNLE